MVHVGTSGFHYKDWVGPFYPDGTPASGMLPHYLKFFRTVELNNPFYRLPSAQTFETWRSSTPAGFVFAVKASRFITHMKKLKDPEPSIEMFFDRVRHLGKKLGPILFQLPPNWKKDVERFSAFLQALPKKYRYTFELRDPSWLDEEIYDLLRQYRAAFCIYELAGFQTPLLTTSDVVYVRLHGPTANKYQGSYDDRRLRGWAERARRWEEEGKDVFIYFDNDQKGYAAADALRLDRMLREGGG